MESRRTTILGFAIALCWFSLYAYLPILPAYARELGASYEMVGLIIGVYGFTQMALRLPLGILSDRLCKRKVFVIIGLVLCLVSSAGMLLIPGVLSLLLFRAMAGGAATTWVVQTVLFTSYYPDSRSAQAIGRLSAVTTGGQMIATLIGGIVAYYFGERSTFLLAAAGGAIGLLISFAITENCPPKREAMTLADITATAKERTLIAASMLALLLQIVVYGTAYGFVPIVAKNIGANSFELGMLPTLFMLPGVFASMISGTFFAARFGGQRSIMAGYLIMTIPVFFLPVIDDINLLYLSQIISGFGRGIAFPLLMQQSIAHIAAHQKATAMGYFQSVYGVGMFMGPVIVGIFADWLGLDWGFWVIGILGMAGTVMTAWLLSRANPAELIPAK